jgi:hypothetical protein
MSDPSKYGYGNTRGADDVPIFGEDHTPPSYTPSAHHPPVGGYPSGYPSGPGELFTGNTPTAAETGTTPISGDDTKEATR